MEKFKSVSNNESETHSISNWQLGKLNLKNVSYHYAESDEPIFHNLNLDFILQNKYILTGDSAAGKSTILNLIGGLLRDYKGEINLGNMSYDQISDHDLHQKISYLQQDPYIFSASLKWNLTLEKRYQLRKLIR